MTIRDLFTPQPACCSSDTNLAAASALLWEHDCGALPVVDEAHRVIGILTDRDICMALATRDQRASNLHARDVMSSPVYQIRSGHSATQALKTMREHKVRRLAVVDAKGTLEGMLSINDLVLAAREGKGEKAIPVSYDELVQTLKALCTHQKKVTSHHEPALV